MYYTSKNTPNRTNDSYSEIMAAPGKLHFWGLCKSVTVNLNSCLFLVWKSDRKMPAKIKVRIVAARDLPVMDRSSDLADAFAEVRNA